MMVIYKLWKIVSKTVLTPSSSEHKLHNTTCRSEQLKWSHERKEWDKMKLREGKRKKFSTFRRWRLFTPNHRCTIFEKYFLAGRKNRHQIPTFLAIFNCAPIRYVGMSVSRVHRSLLSFEKWSRSSFPAISAGVNKANLLILHDFGNLEYRWRE